MKCNARSSPYGLKGLVILGAAAGIVGCSPGASKTSDTGGAGGGSAADFARLQARVDTLEAYRARNADFVAKLSASYTHFYYCDADSQHKDTNRCGPMQNHIKPPQPPPK